MGGSDHCGPFYSDGAAFYSAFVTYVQEDTQQGMRLALGLYCFFVFFLSYVACHLLLIISNETLVKFQLLFCLLVFIAWYLKVSSEKYLLQL